MIRDLLHSYKGGKTMEGRTQEPSGQIPKDVLESTLKLAEMFTAKPVEEAKPGVLWSWPWQHQTQRQQQQQQK